jgi:hemerythrin-like domain-containing protein
MKLIDDLAAEHELIERVAGSLLSYVAGRRVGTAAVADAARFFHFFRVYVGHYHHDREETVLFPALTGDLGLPADRGPVAALLGQHHALASDLAALESLLCAPATDYATIESLARSYVYGLWQHIDAESSVLFPESATRLEKAGLFGLPSRPPDPAERAARDDGESLTRDYPPIPDTSVMRGDGCACCPSYGTTCDGLERTWWSESEWDQLDEYSAE